MQKFRVEITSTAQSDIQEIFHYIAADNQKAAVKLVLEIEKQIDSLEKFQQDALSFLSHSNWVSNTGISFMVITEQFFESKHPE